MKFRLLALVAVWPFQAIAMETSQSCDAAALRAASNYGVPPQVMLAITRAETGRSSDGELRPWPWAVNQAGTSHWFDTPEEATDFVAGAMQEGYSNLDLGCFQLNLRWHGENFPTVEDMFDPVNNADYAARFLVENHERTGNWVDAVAAYHSTRPEDAAAYVERVEAILQDLRDSGGPSADAFTQTAEIQKENRFPLLRSGTSSGLASLVPRSDASRSLIAQEP